MTTSGSIRVLAFGSAAELLGWSEREMPWPPGESVADVIALLERDCPALVDARGTLKIAVNERYATLDTILAEGDEIALIPPVAGGDEIAPVACALVHDPIDVAALVAEVEDERCGAVNVFVGVVRAEQGVQGPLAALEYSAYEPMALREMQDLCDEVAAEHALRCVRLVHRLGRLALREASVAIVTAAPHRAASFDACRQIIEQIKVRVPIFKKELWADGGHSWVEPSDA